MTCQNCGNEFQGNFCSNCGEKKLNKHDLSIGDFSRKGVESFFHLVNKFLRTLKSLLFKPGELSVDFVKGKRVRFMKPLQIFLVINIFLFLSPANPYSLRLYNYLTQDTFTSYHTKEIVDKKLKETKASRTELKTGFNKKIRTESKFFIFLYIPSYALIFFLFFWYRKKNFTDHLVFSSHFVSFYLLFYILSYLILVIPFYFFAETNLYPVFIEAFAAFFIISITIYLFFAIRKFYESSIFMSVICSLAFCLSYAFFVHLYRMLMFVKIMKFDL